MNLIKVSIMIKTQRGFAVLEAVLILVIVGIITAAGYYVWQSSQKANKSLNNASDSSALKSNDETAAWYLYESPGNKYSIRIPDGWDLYQNGSDSFSPLLEDLNGLAIKSGTKGKVDAGPAYGKDRDTGFSIDYADPSASDDTAKSLTDGATKLPDLKTKSGLTIQRYDYVQTKDPEGPGLPKGGKAYIYLIFKDKKLVTCWYGIHNSDADYHENIEKALRTVEIF
jgi:type II secretory pathway pseudopilin PulG